MPKMFNAVIIIIIIIIILITIIIFFSSFFKYRYILFCLNWEFAKPFVPTAFLIYISILTIIILDKKFLLGYLLKLPVSHGLL